MDNNDVISVLNKARAVTSIDASSWGAVAVRRNTRSAPAASESRPAAVQVKVRGAETAHA